MSGRILTRTYGLDLPNARQVAQRIWECWEHARQRIDTLTPLDTVHANRALYAFRDRARKIL